MNTNISTWSNLKPRLRFIEEPNPDGATPKPDEDQGKPNDADLGDAGKRAIAAEREGRKAAEKELKTLRDAEEKRQRESMSEVERLKAEIADRDKVLTPLQKENLRYKVALATPDFPANLITRLQGETEEEIKADALELMKAFPSSDAKRRGPKPDPTQSRRNESKGGTTKDQFVDAIEDLFN